MKKNNFLIVVVLCVFLLHSVYAVIPQTLNLQGKLTNSSDDALTGTYNMTFRIYDVVTGGSSLWVSVNNSITTDGDGIYNFVLNDVNLSFDQEYYVGIKVESDAEMTPRINLTSTPYTFRTQNISAEGILNDSNVNLVGYNVTASSGLFSWLGSLLSRITTLFVQDIDFTGTINGSGWINTTANISADYYYGDGSKLTNLPSGGNLTWNESHAETLFAPNTTAGIQHLINDTGIYETYNATYALYNDTDLILSVNTTANIQGLLNATGVYETYNITYDSYALNVSKNYTLDTYTNWGSNWYNHTLSTFNTWNSTWDESGWATDTFLSIANSAWNRSGTNVFLGYTGDKVGIGTASPSYKLHTVSNDLELGLVNLFTLEHTISNVTNGTAGLAAGILFRGEDSLANIENIAQIVGVLKTATNSSEEGELAFYTGSSNTTGNVHLTEKMRIDDSGYVGIGTTSPTHKLNVIGDVNISGDLLVTNLLNLSGINFFHSVGVISEPKEYTIQAIGSDGLITFTKILIGEDQISDLQTYVINNTAGWTLNLSTLFVNGINISTWEENVSKNYTLDTYTNWNAAWISTYNTTYDSYALNVSKNYTLDTFNTWGSNWYNHTLSTFNTWNSTWDESGWATDTFLSIANSGWNRSGTNVFLGYTGDKVGIGTSSPGSKLTVWEGDFNVSNKARGQMFYVQNSTGNVGIGTITPSQKLEVNGFILADNFNATGVFTIVGEQAGYSNIGNWVTVVGNAAGYLNKGDYFTATGYTAGQSNKGNDSTAFGAYAGRSNTGNKLTAIGYFAGRSNTGKEVTASGYYAGYLNKGDYITTSGMYAGYDNIGNKSVFTGYYSGFMNTANYVTAVGYNAARSNTAGALTAFGYYAGYENSGLTSTLIGSNAGQSNTGNFITALGPVTAGSNKGDYLVTVGYYSSYSNKGNYSIGIGYEALYKNNASNVVAIGHQAGKNNALPDQFILKQGNVNAVPLIQGNFSSGNVGINITTPSYKLHVDGDAYFTKNVSVGMANFGKTFSSSGTSFLGGEGTGVKIDATTISAVYGPDGAGDGNIPLYIKAAGTSNLYLRGGLTGGDVVFDQGNVGIATTSPSHPFTVQGNMNLTGSVNFDVGRGQVMFESNSLDNIDGAGITLRTLANPTSAGGSIFAVRSSGQATRFWVGQSFTSSGNNDFYVKSSSSSVANDTSLYGSKIGGATDTYFNINGGDVGIGTSSPTQRLHVNGSANITGNIHIGGNFSLDGEVIGQESSRVRVTKNDAQSIPNAVSTKVQYDDEDYDTLGEFNSSNQFTATEAGYYLVSAGALSADASWTEGEFWQIIIRKNGVAVSRSGRTEFSDAVTTLAQADITDVVYLAANDYIEICVGHTQGAAVNLYASATDNYLSIQRLRSSVTIGTGGIAAGAIVAFNSETCPTGWVVADGTSGTPDLRGIFVRGAGTSGAYQMANGTYYTAPFGTSMLDLFQKHYHQLQGLGQVLINTGATYGVPKDGGGTSELNIKVKDPTTAGAATGTPRFGGETAPASYALTYCMKTTEDTNISNTIWATSGNNVILNNASKNLSLVDTPTVHYAPNSSEPSAGTYHPTGTVLIRGGYALTSTIASSDLTDKVPVGTNAVRLLIYYDTTTAGFYGAVGPTSSCGDDLFFGYTDNSYISDHLISRLGVGEMLYYKASAGAATIYIYMTGYYI